MLWAIDIGNTETVLGGWDGVWRHVWRISTRIGRTADEWAAILHSRADTAGARLADASSVVVCSVVPESDRVWGATMETLGMPGPVFLRSGQQVGIEVLYHPPTGVGADRIANALHAKEVGKLPCIVVDIGTATTLDAIDGEGRYLGGAILPGPQLMMGALASKAAQLSAASLDRPAVVIGRDTGSALRSGVVVGHAGAVDRLVLEFKKELGPAHVVSTGGLSALILSECSVAMEWVPNWTLDGLRLAEPYLRHLTP
ncbi:MAG: type III pantothenate kinase [Fimbriimonadaceae bacterium]|nr:type III pantothenate kinase [Fimbriimonadaceae bacterium]